ncbi:serine hydrolase [Desulfitobacterium metallireducens]|uniref:Beta-lactamase n=1 Tax=Desulfitobacterium metallireducens DSM 15288 TaxID=871968 RepID=W0EFC9_9FIRM|nr:serine hydrolase [Desulfitobacterium metallireducens]AHF08198.1 beta-lactamase [Desulfitobacterium metallireducens DSM 15288]
MERRPLNILIFLICTIFFISLWPASTNAEAPDTNINIKKIDEFVNMRMSALNIPGLSVGIVKNDKILYIKGYGKANENGKDVQAQTPFIIGSLSKSFTATAIMQLVEKGKIKLDDPVQQYLPWFSLADSEASKKITLRNLLTHTSGISGYDSAKFIMNDNMNLEQFVRNLKNTQISKPVGSTFQYCNVNYGILGEIIQTVSGISYEEYIQKNIFNPLEMNNSYTSQIEARKAGLAVGHNSILGIVMPTTQPLHQGSIPSGYLISTAEDMSHYLIAQMNNGRYKNNSILSPDSVNQMHEASSAAANDYGMGWMLLPDMIFHNGDTENFHSHMRILRGTDYGLIILLNFNDSLMPISLGKDGFESIPNGIIDIISGKEVQSNSTRNMNNIYLKINILIVLVIIIFIWRVFRLKKWSKRLRSASFNTKITVAFLLLFNVLLPSALLMLIPKVFNSPWRTILAFGPGLGHFLLFLPISFFIIGFIKTVILLSHVVRLNISNAENL